MQPLYESVPDDLEIYDRPSRHFAPNVHMLAECVCCLSDTLELGVDANYYHMEAGDFAVIFPGKIHHSQYFGTSDSAVCLHLLFSPSLVPSFRDILGRKQPEVPVIKKDDVDPDIVYALERLYTDYAVELTPRAMPAENTPEGTILATSAEGFLTSSDSSCTSDQSSGTLNSLPRHNQNAYDKPVKSAFLEIILARSLPKLTLVDRTGRENTDLVYRIVNYIAANFKEPLTLTGMAEALYISPYVLSRQFSGTFHSSFNRYLDETRLGYAVNLLSYTGRSITDIWLEAGFESQRTFNRVFREKYHMSPRDYRKSLQKRS